MPDVASASLESEVESWEHAYEKRETVRSSLSNVEVPKGQESFAQEIDEFLGKSLEEGLNETKTLIKGKGKYSKKYSFSI